MDFLPNIPGVHLLGGVYVIARALFLALDVVLILLIIYVIPKAWKFHPHFDVGKGKPKEKMKNLRRSYFKDRWEKLLKKYTATPTPDSLRLAIIEADALVDNLLKDMNFPGDHLADRLSYLNNQQIKSLEGLWEAHRLRNEVVHHPTGAISVRQGTAALTKYEAFFKELEVI